MVLPDENERCGSVHLSPPPKWTCLRHFGFGLFEPGRLPDLTAFTSSGERTLEEYGEVAVCGSLRQHSQPYNLVIDVGVSTSSGHHVKLLA